MPPVKKQGRPRIDAVTRHIKAGSYDNEMSQLIEAIDARQEQRKEAVLETVREVFGSDYTVLPESQKPLQPPALPPRRQRPGGSVKEQDPDLAAAEKRAREQEEALRRESGGDVPAETQRIDPGDGLGPDEQHPDDESRSPVIGSIDESQRQEET